MESYPSESLQQRLAAGLGNKGGARGSLTRCAGRLGSLKRALEVESSSSGSSEVKSTIDKDAAAAAADAATTGSTTDGHDSPQETAELLSRELQLAHIEMTKLFLLARRQEAELEQMRTSSSKILTEKIAAERAAVEELRQGLQQASSTVACQREYESLAKLASSRHPTARRVLQEQMDQVQAQLVQTQQDFRTATAHVDIREKQFQLLIQCMLDLKQSLSEPLDLDDQVGGGTRSAKKAAAAQDTMEGVEKISGDDDEAALYGDL